jgi:signal transduction histidine kinase
MPDKIKILYVDDEPENLVGFKASLRFDYQIFTAANIAEALNYLQRHEDIRIIFCDQRMPGKTGVEFFEDIRTKYPLPVRILITGYTDIESVINAINFGNVFRYLKKPWTDADLISAIDEANQFYITSSLLTIRNEELQKAYHELDKFAYSVTHDIRGPLLGITGAINLARDMHDLTEMKEMLYLMQKSLSKLDTYILSMHDYYSLKRGELQIAEIDLHALINEQEDVYHIFAGASDIHFETHIEQREPFRCDEVTLKLIINNLLSNAFKYQKRNGDKTNKFVRLELKAENGLLEMIVTDNGIGINKEHIGEIYNLFFRAGSQEAGAGFGLYNVKNAVNKLNGHIDVDSVPDVGTTFRVMIPNK